MPPEVVQTAAHPVYVRWFRRLARPLVRGLFYILADVTIHGQEHIPAPGACLITPNHLATYDPPLLLTFWPYSLEVMGAANIRDGRDFFGFVSRSYGTYPVNRDGVDTVALRTALRLLADDKPVLLAPEGGRSPTGLRAGHPGAAYLALKAKVPIIPVGITGTENMFAAGTRPRWSLAMRIGRPYTLPDLPLTPRERKQSMAEATEIIMRQIADLIPPEYRGIYA